MENFDILYNMLLLKCLVVYRLLLLVFCAPEDEYVVRIYNGNVLGNEQITAKNSTYYAFQGMPFAQPPVGTLRFRAPFPATNWTGVYNGTYTRSGCTSTRNFLTDTTVVGQEDCLYINVYTPQLPKNGSEPLAVIVWIYGGGFVAGSADEYPPDRFMDAGGVIFVSFNYRLGAFGFLSTEDDIIPGNYGLKDQVLALQWVQQNIAVFGGNPKNVTIMGESAGAASVHFLIQCDRAAGLFQRAIAESGSSLLPWSQAANARKLAFRIGLANGIWTCSSKTLLENLRRVDANHLMRNSFLPTFLDLYDPLNGLPFGPVIENKSPEAVVTRKSYDQLFQGKFNRVSLLHGFNSLEGRDAAQLPWYGFILLEPYNLCSCNLCPADMNASTDGKNTAGAEIKKFYFGNQLVVQGTNLVNYVSDDEFVRGTVKTGQLMSKYVDVYLYRFAFTGGVEHKNFTPEGAAHTEELQFLFLTNTTVQTTPEAQLTVDRMMKMWTNFAKTGNPTPFVTETVNVTWPLINETGYNEVHYLNIDVNLTTKINPENTQLSFWKSLYFQYGYPPYNTY